MNSKSKNSLNEKLSLFVLQLLEGTRCKQGNSDEERVAELKRLYEATYSQKFSEFEKFRQLVMFICLVLLSAILLYLCNRLIWSENGLVLTFLIEVDDAMLFRESSGYFKYTWHVRWNVKSLVGKRKENGGIVNVHS